MRLPNPALIPRNNWDFKTRDLFTSVVGSFQEKFSPHSAIAELFGSEAVLTTSGRASLVAILRALQLPRGSGVAVPLYCCQVVFEAIVHAGCVPIFVDVDEDDHCISPHDLRGKLHRVSAIIAVHMFGHPADMNRLREVAGEIPLIEDCAHSLFSEYQGKATGWLGDAAFFSFRNGKYLSSGEGSVVLARDPRLREKIAGIVGSYRTWNRPREIMHALFSYAKAVGYRRPAYGLAGHRLGRALDEGLNLSAKSGIDLRRISRGYHGLIEDRLKDFRVKVERQRSNSDVLLQAIREGPVVLPKESGSVRWNGYHFGIRLPDRRHRDSLSEFLFQRGIDTSPYLDDITEIATGQYAYTGGCPVSEGLAKTLLVLPNHYSLTSSMIRSVADSVNLWSDRCSSMAPIRITVESV
jgi:dTDP-4-amino-4,6-dideoxygalactose transaminase